MTIPCPTCGASTRVVDVRSVNGAVGTAKVLWRRRECLADATHHRCTTYEVPADAGLDGNAAIEALKKVRTAVEEFDAEVHRRLRPGPRG